MTSDLRLRNKLKAHVIGREPKQFIKILNKSFHVGSAFLGRGALALSLVRAQEVWLNFTKMSRSETVGKAKSFPFAKSYLSP